MNKKTKKEKPPSAGKSGKYQTLNPGSLYAWPMGLWFIIFFIVPLVIIIGYSFMKKGLYGGVENQFSLNAYRQMFNYKYGILVIRTLKISVISTFFTILIAIPCGYAMARSKHQTLLLLLVMIPFWTNSLIRIFAWMSILDGNGIVNQILMKLGLIKTQLNMLYTQETVILVLIYMYLPYAILPIFTSIDRFDFSLLEAARDLGATKPQSMMKILLPGIRSGIFTAIIFTFIPIFGAYTVPLLVGGKDSYMLGNIIVDQVNKTRNWPLAAAFSMIITIVSTLGVLWVFVSNSNDIAQKESSTKEENYVTDAPTAGDSVK